MIGKTNVPEFGLGSQTFNTVFGATRNPTTSRRHAGEARGRGGGSGLWHGAAGRWSDYGGSLRNPPNFCGVVGLRPSPGRVPNTPADLAWQPFSVVGGVARNVKDLAYFLSVLAGPEERIPISIEQPVASLCSRLVGEALRECA